MCTCGLAAWELVELHQPPDDGHEAAWQNRQTSIDTSMLEHARRPSAERPREPVPAALRRAGRALRGVGGDESRSWI